MKNLTISLAMFLMSVNSFATETPTPTTPSKSVNSSKVWNTNTDKVRTFKKGDLITIIKGSDSSKYLSGGIVQHVCNKDFIKVNNYFVKVVDVEMIVKYSNVK